MTTAQTRSYLTITEALGTFTSDIMPYGTLNFLRGFAKQVSAAFQSTPKGFMEKVESHLNRYGYSLMLDAETLEDMDESTVFDDDLFIYVAGTKDVVRNVYMSVKWEEISGKQFDWRSDGSKLRLDAKISFNEISEEDMDAVLSPEDDVLPESFYSDVKALMKEDIDLKEAAMVLSKYKDDLLAALADVAFSGNKVAARGFVDRLDFNQYLEISQAIADGEDEEDVVKLVHKFK